MKKLLKTSFSIFVSLIFLNLIAGVSFSFAESGSDEKTVQNTCKKTMRAEEAYRKKKERCTLRPNTKECKAFRIAEKKKADKAEIHDSCVDNPQNCLGSGAVTTSVVRQGNRRISIKERRQLGTR